MVAALNITMARAAERMPDRRRQRRRGFIDEILEPAGLPNAVDASAAIAQSARSGRTAASHALHRADCARRERISELRKVRRRKTSGFLQVNGVHACASRDDPVARISYRRVAKEMVRIRFGERAADPAIFSQAIMGVPKLFSLSHFLERCGGVRARHAGRLL